MRKTGALMLLLVHAATAKPEPLSKEELHKLSADDRTPYAGEYATELCSGKPPGPVSYTHLTLPTTPYV